MCKAFSAIVLESGEVLWEMGMDSHSEILEKHKIKDDTADPKHLMFARVEIAPKNNNYLKPDKWVFRLDQRIKPRWWNKAYRQYAWEAWAEWKKELDSILVYKDIIHPFKDVRIRKRTTKWDVDLLRQWDSAWRSVGRSVRDSVWDSVGRSVRDSVRDSVWDSVGDSVWDSVWDSVGRSVWDSVRDSVGRSVRDSVGASVEAYLGSFFNLPRYAWKYTDKIKTDGYPFQPAVDLWERGLVPSFDGKTWRLHAGPDGRVVREWLTEAGKEATND